jgi:hypothetical protein
MATFPGEAEVKNLDQEAQQYPGFSLLLLAPAVLMLSFLRMVRYILVSQAGAVRLKKRLLARQLPCMQKFAVFLPVGISAGGYLLRCIMKSLRPLSKGLLYASSPGCANRQSSKNGEVNSRRERLAGGSWPSGRIPPHDIRAHQNVLASQSPPRRDSRGWTCSLVLGLDVRRDSLLSHRLSAAPCFTSPNTWPSSDSTIPATSTVERDER